MKYTLKVYGETQKHKIVKACKNNKPWKQSTTCVCVEDKLFNLYFVFGQSIRAEPQRTVLKTIIKNNTFILVKLTCVRLQ